MFAWQATVQDEFGNAVALPVVTVYEADGVTLADIYNESGDPIDNPVTGTMEGFVQFWANAGQYKIVGVFGGDETAEWSVFLDTPLADAVADADAARDRAQAWAESPTAPDPLDPASKSAKTWAGEAAASAVHADAEADRAETARDDAQGVLDDRLRKDVATLLADTTLTYTAAQPGTVVAGDIVRTRAEGFAYQVATSGATDHHVTTAGGVKLYVKSNDVRAFGAAGDGVTDDTAEFSAAAAQFPIVRVPYSAAGYGVGAGVAPGTATFVFDGGETQLSGIATPENVNGLFNIAGRPGGVLFAPALRTKKLCMVAGAIRQDATDRTKWNFISDSAHTPVGVSGVFATASGPAIVISFDRTYTKVVSFVSGPDEELAGKMGLTVGASVGLSSATLWASARLHGAAVIYYNGTSWVISEGANQNLFHTPTFSGSTLTVQNNWCPGIGLSVSPYTVNGAVVPYTPAIKDIGNTSFTVSFVDAGTFVSSANTRMAFAVQKHYEEALTLDGATTSLGNASQLPLNLGNIWFQGIFQEGA